MSKEYKISEADFAHLGRGELFEPWEMPTRKRREKRKPNLASALKQASNAGANVSGATIAADGSVSLEFGDGEKKPDDNKGANEWDSIQ